jgi:DUF1680 family protein
MNSQNDLSQLTRRQFVHAAGAGAAAFMLSGAASAPTEPDRHFEHGNPLKEFSYGDVVFQPGLHQSQLEQTHAILMGLDEDSLLRPFRLAAGRPAPGWDLGGWYSATPTLVKTGPSGPETFGQWISALSRYYAATGDEATRLKVERLVNEYAKTIEPSGKVFQFSKGPTYFYDKLTCGLVDAYEFVGLKSALGMLTSTTDAALSHLAGRAIDQLGPEGAKSSESYTVPENQFIAWQRGGNGRHLAMAKQYLADDFYFDPLARGKNVLPGRHAYSHMNALSSAAKAYLVLGDERYLKAAVNGLVFAEQQSWATGAWGFGESFVPASLDAEDRKFLGINLTSIDTLGEALKYFKWHFETPCGAYAHFKLMRYLLRITKDPHYGDSMERVMYNTVLGALPLNQFGKAFYQSNYHAHGHKEYFDGYGHSMPDEWPCCSGTLPQIAADYRISSYFNDVDGVYINLYIPSTVNWRQGGVDISLTQSGPYPLADTVVIETKASQPITFAVRLRIPAWSTSPSLHLNGRPYDKPVQPGTFATVWREWRAGDRIELRLPRQLELKPVDAAYPNMAALVSGPLVLFAVSDDSPKVTRDQLLAAKQEAPASREWLAESSNGPVRLLPWFGIKDETYFTYLSV